MNSFNNEILCGPCEVASRGERHQPPTVPPSFWRTDQMRDACGTWHMGRVIYAYRTHPFHIRQLPQELMATWLGLTQAQLSRIEKGPAPEQLSKLIRWAEALGIPHELLWFKLPDSDAASTVATSSTGDDAVALAQWLTSNGTSPPPPNRGEELARVGRALDDARRYFDGSVMEFFRTQLVRCKTDDGFLGPAEALPLTLAVIGAIRRHSRDVQPEVRRQLLALGADGAEFAGWLYRDLHDPLTATFLYDRAMEWAQAAGSLPMQGYILLKKSQMAYETRDSGTVLTLAQAAGGGPWQLPMRVKAEAVQQEALGLAMIGEPASVVDHHLGEAEKLLAQADRDDDHLFGTYFTNDTLLLRSASCYTEAGKPRRSSQLYTTVLDSGRLSKRDQGFFSARQAHALALSGEPDEAADLATKAIAVARETHSERTMNVVLEVMRALEPWRTRTRVRALVGVLRPRG
ncbi:helix-turn-helix domain-containing protein [Nocardia aurantia]|nr:helix-turn-helix transcriptional regulator [Nocardia aurantia]